MCSWTTTISRGALVYGLATDASYFYVAMGDGDDPRYVARWRKAALAGDGELAYVIEHDFGGGGALFGRGILRRVERTFVTLERGDSAWLVVHVDGRSGLETISLPAGDFPAGTTQDDVLVGDDDAVYIAHENRLLKVLGNDVAIVATFDSVLASIALDDRFVFVAVPGDLDEASATHAPNGRIVAVPKDGGDPLTLTEGQRSPRSLAMAEGAVYWVDSEEGRLLRVATP
jgi:hypothetical protein